MKREQYKKGNWCSRQSIRGINSFANKCYRVNLKTWQLEKGQIWLGTLQSWQAMQQEVPTDRTAQHKLIAVESGGNQQSFFQLWSPRIINVRPPFSPRPKHLERQLVTASDCDLTVHEGGANLGFRQDFAKYKPTYMLIISWHLSSCFALHLKNKPYYPVKFVSPKSATFFVVLA